MRIFQYRISANDPEISDPGDREHSLCSEDFSERILLSQLPLYLDERARRTDFAPLAPDFPGDQPVPGGGTSAGTGPGFHGDDGACLAVALACGGFLGCYCRWRFLAVPRTSPTAF